MKNPTPDSSALGPGGQFAELTQSAISAGRAMAINGEAIEFDAEDSCTTNADCDAYPYEVCGIDEPGECGHKKVFPPTALEIAGLLTFSLVMALCVVAGIGGGGIAVALIIAFFGFTTKPAVALSSFSILVNAIMRYVYNWKTSNPSAHKPGMALVDYSLASVMSPTTLAGSQIGGLVLEIFPSLYINVLLTILLGLLGLQSARKAWELHKKEDAEKIAKTSNVGAPAAKAADGVDTGRDGVNASTLDTASDKTSVISGTTKPQEIEEEQNLIAQNNSHVTINDKKFALNKSAQENKDLLTLSSIIESEKGHAQWKKQGIVWTLILIVILMNLMLGSSDFNSIVGIKECDLWYWLIQVVFVIICVISTVIAIQLNQ